jgi:hypothetical protein
MKVKEMLSNLLQNDERGRYSYLDFIKEYNQAEDTPA